MVSDFDRQLTVVTGLSIRGGRPGFYTIYYECGHHYYFQRKIEPKETPSCLIPRLLFVFTWQLKTKSTRKLSNLNFRWTKTLYQKNLKNIAFFFTFFKDYRCNLSSVITPKKISHGSPRKRMSNFTRNVKTQVKF